VLIAVAAWPLALIGGGALSVSFSAQYACIVAVRRQDTASVVEAPLVDLLMIVFALLALGLSRAGKSSRAERTLILACAAASAYLNISAADVACPRSFARVCGRADRAGRGVDQVVAVTCQPVRLRRSVCRLGRSSPRPHDHRRPAGQMQRWSTMRGRSLRRAHLTSGVCAEVGGWWGGWGSNPRPADYESAALTG
jgi:hypothetical protein